MEQAEGCEARIAIDHVPERLALAKNVIGCDIIDISQEKDVGAIYKMELEGVDCAIDAAAFRYTKGIL